MFKCPACSGAMKPLFQSYFCPNDCDRRVPSVGLGPLRWKVTDIKRPYANLITDMKVRRLPEINKPCPQFCGMRVGFIHKKPDYTYFACFSDPFHPDWPPIFHLGWFAVLAKSKHAWFAEEIA